MTKKKTASFPPLEYDALNPRYAVQHRAGIAGLYLQMEAMKWLRDAANDEEKGRYIVPEYDLTQGGRVLTVTFTEESFFSLMRERYRGIWIERKFDKKKTERKTKGKRTKPKSSKKPKTKKSNKTEPQQEPWQFIGEFEKTDRNGKTIRDDQDKPVMGYRYNILYPLFDYFRAFGASERWEMHVRKATWASYYSSPPTRPGHFKTDPSPATVNKYAKDLWAKLSRANVRDKHVEVVKNFYLNSFNTDFKDVKIKEFAKDALLLHFSSIVAMLYRPQHLEFKSEEINGEKFLKCEYKTGAPIIAVPAIRDIDKFAHKFKQKVAACCKGDSSKSTWFHPDLTISTPAEGSLAYFVAPRWAQKDVIDWARYVDGVEIYVFRAPPKKTDQAVVVNVINRPVDDDSIYMLEQYNRLIKGIHSLPYRALRISNLLRGRKWYDDFHQLAAEYPLELFVNHNVSNKKLNEEAGKMAYSIRKDLEYYMNINYQEDIEMAESPPNEKNAANKQPLSLERLIYHLTANYLRTRAREKFKTDESEKDVSFDFIDRWYKFRKEKHEAPTEQDRQDDELMRKYHEKLQKAGEDLFIKFRACRNQPKFARLFTEVLCMKPFGQLTPERQEKLAPYLYENEWLRGKGLVLMSICAASYVDTRTIAELGEAIESISDPEESSEEAESED